MDENMKEKVRRSLVKSRDVYFSEANAKRD